MSALTTTQPALPSMWSTDLGNLSIFSTSLPRTEQSAAQVSSALQVPLSQIALVEKGLENDLQHAVEIQKKLEKSFNLEQQLPLQERQQSVSVSQQQQCATTRHASGAALESCLVQKEEVRDGQPTLEKKLVTTTHPPLYIFGTMRQVMECLTDVACERALLCVRPQLVTTSQPLAVQQTKDLVHALVQVQHAMCEQYKKTTASSKLPTVLTEGSEKTQKLTRQLQVLYRSFATQTERFYHCLKLAVRDLCSEFAHRHGHKHHGSHATDQELLDFTTLTAHCKSVLSKCAAKVQLPVHNHWHFVNNLAYDLQAAQIQDEEMGVVSVFHNVNTTETCSLLVTWIETLNHMLAQYKSQHKQHKQHTPVD